MMFDQPAPASFEGDPPVAAAETAMPDRRELALVAIERTRMPMVVTDPQQPDNPIVLANGAFLALTGYTADEVIGQNCRFLQGPDTKSADVEAIRRGLADGRDHIELEVLNYRKDGSTFWNQVAISPVRNEAGELIYYFASQKDVTARRRIEQMEATERLLLMEIDHRAMNALTLVQSIVRLSRTVSIPDYSSSVLGRVDALARAHRRLTQSAWMGVDLEQLVTDEVPSEARQRVSTAGYPVELPAQFVQPFALVLHELMSNACKHGALASKTGQVTLSWTVELGQLILDWQEEGTRSTDTPLTLGLGLRMTLGIIEQQLGGTATPSWNNPGFRITMTLPTSEWSART
jgi:PAS domain S-box-containing protein